MTKTPNRAVQAEKAFTFIEDLAAEMLRKMEKVSPDLADAPRPVREKTQFMLTYVTLFHAGLLAFESLIKDPTQAEVFDDALHAAFQRKLGEDPRPHIRRYLQYAEKVGDRGYVQFVGFSVAEALAKRDVLLAVEMCKAYADVIDAKLEKGLRNIVL